MKSQESFQASENYWQKKADVFAGLYRTLNPLQVPNRIFLKQRMDVIARYVHSDAKGLVVDVGCGSGEFARELADKFGRVIAVDYSQIMLDLAKAKTSAKNVEFHKGDSATLPVSDASADALFALGLLDYVKDIPATLKEFSRVMKSGATAVVTAPKSPSLFAPLRWSSALRAALFRIPPIVHALSRNELDNLISSCGFIPVEITSLWTTMWICCVKKV